MQGGKILSKQFVNLHAHSHYSILDGYAKIDEYVDKAKNRGDIGVGLTDHGTMAGIYEFITKANAAGLKPVPGFEAYVAPENPEGAKVQHAVFYGPDGKKAPNHDVSGNGAYLHLTLFAYNNTGLHNLIKLSSLSWQQENFYAKPRIDTEMLFKYHEGLIVTTGCPSSEISTRFLLGQDDKAYEYASRLHEVFGDNMYVEIMDHHMKDDMERFLLKKQRKLAEDLGLPLLATNDSHYANKEDAIPHERMLCMQSGNVMSEPSFNEGGKRFAFTGPEYYMKSDKEMRELFPEDLYPGAVDNTVKVVEQCEEIQLEYNPHLRPIPPLPEGETEVSYLKKLINKGFKAKRGNESKAIQKESLKRIKEEFEVINSNDFAGYFLIVNDYIQWSHDHGITTGAGRGSVGGSEIAYVMDIGDTDPIRFDLLFERFLSPGRGAMYQIDYTDGTSEEANTGDKREVVNSDKDVEKYVHELTPGESVEHDGIVKEIKSLEVIRPGSAPDIDTDFHTEGREKAVQHVVDTYGRLNVSNIITFGTFKAKNSLKSMATIYQIPFAESNRVAQLIPKPIDGKECSLDDIYNPDSPRYAEAEDFRRAVDNDHWREVIKMARPLSGRIRETGIHACGIVISSNPIEDTVPTQVRQNDGTLMTQWTYPACESLGLIKMDFLGLDTLDIIDNTLKNIKVEGKKVPDMTALIRGKMDDKKTYKLLQNAETTGIFQLGSPGMRDLLERVKPTEFEDLAAVTALYRPGPMKMNSHIQYADRKNGREKISYIDNEFAGGPVEDVLKKTYGLVIYQESCMQLATRAAGMSSYESDKLRKAIGKKKMKIMMQLRPKFIEGIENNGYSEKAADELWDTVQQFGQYGFNKSHSVSYGINAYKTCYLKANYPAEFMSALIQQNTGDPKKIMMFLQEAKRMGLRVGPVDVNDSQAFVAPAKDKTRFDIIYGFSGIKQVSDDLSNEIIKERESGKYKSPADFVERVTKCTTMNSQALKNLALSGAFDKMHVSRRAIVEKASALLTTAKSTNTQQRSLFDLIPKSNDSMMASIDLSAPEYPYNELIKLEADCIGIYVSGTPTAHLGSLAHIFSPTKIKDIQSGNATGVVNVLGSFTMMDAKTKKNGNRSVAVRIDDGSGFFDVYLPNQLVNSIDKGAEIIRRRKLEAAGKPLKMGTSKRAVKLQELIDDESVVPVSPITLNEPFIIQVKIMRKQDSVRLLVNKFKKIATSYDGSIPFDIAIPTNVNANIVANYLNKHKGDTYVRAYIQNNGWKFFNQRVSLSQEFIEGLENIIGGKNILTKGA